MARRQASPLDYRLDPPWIREWAFSPGCGGDWMESLPTEDSLRGSPCWRRGGTRQVRLQVVDDRRRRHCRCKRPCRTLRTAGRLFEELGPDRAFPVMAR